MADQSTPRVAPDAPQIYSIRVQGHLGPQLAGCFDGLSITLEASGDTLLTGAVADQAALYGFLRKVRDLGLPLVAVNRAPTLPIEHS